MCLNVELDNFYLGLYEEGSIVAAKKITATRPAIDMRLFHLYLSVCILPEVGSFIIDKCLLCLDFNMKGLPDPRTCPSRLWGLTCDVEERWAERPLTAPTSAQRLCRGPGSHVTSRLSPRRKVGACATAVTSLQELGIRH